ncbi:MAG: F0F1 ATP synthase subunit epsilon [Arthrobacter sp.]|jgi:F-type H+-transporting ATPase subunit epsilon|nr:F0F1 ATP synthase subunit epsilon [Arthrobacter sp.]
MAQLDVEVVSADHAVWSGAARRVNAFTVNGDIGVLPGHTPVIALLAAGRVEVEPLEGPRVHIKADGGFFSVENNRVTIVADDAVVDATA